MNIEATFNPRAQRRKGAMERGPQAAEVPVVLGALERGSSAGSFCGMNAALQLFASLRLCVLALNLIRRNWLPVFSALKPL
ncbi:MAG: hypothetical protein HZA92_09805 [Verrucomicrobia bacterium]|nr:hypothetical protein [Verrucomicrobiota bacterium]